MDYEEWLDKNYDNLMIECAETGADRELDFDFDRFAEKRYYSLFTSQDFEFWLLDFRHVEGNMQIQGQGQLICVRTATKGFFSPQLERYPSRQDLAIKTRLGTNSVTFSV